MFVRFTNFNIFFPLGLFHVIQCAWYFLNMIFSVKIENKDIHTYKGSCFEYLLQNLGDKLEL